MDPKTFIAKYSPSTVTVVFREKNDPSKLKQETFRSPEKALESLPEIREKYSIDLVIIHSEYAVRPLEAPELEELLSHI